jgi:hypothetical protein
LKRDPFYQEILEGLKRQLDPDLFEQCCADILRHDFPALVPIRGGGDAGMDGAIADGKGFPFPLICTTGKSVIRNFTKNINSYLKNGGTRRKAVLATSQELTFKKRKNLETRGQKLGFVLVQIYSQGAIADRLYYNQHWCKELLNLTGEPSPISVVPCTSRPLLGDTIIGREQDINWVQETKGDRLLVGQPGSGKTFLLHIYAKRGGGFFVIKKDRSAVASAVRSIKPAALFLDDAHIETKFLTELRQLREEIAGSFEIIATCWPNAQQKVADSLNIPSSSIHTLELLTRDEIVSILKLVGIQGPVELIREIVDQAQGRPGLAVTLAYLCLKGDVQRVALGDALSRSILDTFEPLVGKKASGILAAFAIGGDSGMPIRIVADFLKQPEIDIQHVVTELASGGVITEMSQTNTLSVNPPALRFALVRDIFFKGPASLDPERLIVNAPFLAGVAFTLIGAKARGALVPRDQLISILERAKSVDAWEAYAWLGRDESNAVLERHPELLIKVARAALHRSSEKVIPLLLRAALGDERQLHSAPDHPLRLISDWINESRPGSGQVVKRRTALLEVIKNLVSKEENTKACLKALSFVFSLKYERHTSDPGLGRTITFTHGPITLDEVRSVGKLWPLALAIIKKIKALDWLLLIEIIDEVAFPFISNTYPGFYESRREIAAQMLRDLISLPKVGPGFSHRINGIARQLEMDLKMNLDKEFETLFPYEELDDWKTAQEQQNKAVKELSGEWAKLPLHRVVRRIALYEREAKAAGINFPRWTLGLCWELAQRVEKRLPWVKHMSRVGVAGELIGPLFRQAALKDESGWEKVMTEFLGIENLRWVAIPILLTLPNAPSYLIKKALQNLAGLAETIEMLCWRKEVPEKTLALLLCHPDALIAGSAAVGEWQGDPRGKVRETLKMDWERAILRMNYKEYWLGEILKNDPELSFKWLKLRITEKEVPYEMLRTYQSAILPLGNDKREELLGIIPSDTWRGEIVDYLIGDSLELYQVLLRDNDKKDLHLLPLHGFKRDVIEKETWEETSWVAKAMVALNAGYTAEEIEEAIFSPMWSWSDNESEFWRRWIRNYEKLLSHLDPRIQKIGEIGKKKASRALDRSLKEERREAIYGYD